MATKRYMLIVNPHSGTGTVSIPELESDVCRALEGPDVEIEIRHSEYAGHCEILAREAVERNFYAVIAAGGDGTVNETARAVRDSGTILGIIPCGSGNGLARHLGLSIDIDNALRIIAADNPKPCDYCSANGQPFFCTFGLGFDAAVSETFAAQNRRGLTTYVRSAIHEYLTYKPQDYEIKIAGRSLRIKAFLIAVCNASQYGNNAYIAPDASIRDGLLDITVIHAGNPITRTLLGVDLFTGHLKRNVLVQTFRVAEATIIRQQGPAHLDGDPVDMPGDITVKCHPGGLNIFLDPNKKRFHPVITPLRSMHFDLWFHIRYGWRNLYHRLRYTNKN